MHGSSPQSLSIDRTPGKYAPPQAARLAGSSRLHLQHGPIDLIIDADGQAQEVALALKQATSAFDTVLETLVTELALLRQPVSNITANANANANATGPVAQLMVNAVAVHQDQFITPMAAVAGAVADYVLSQLLHGRTLSRAYVNNGGDIALYLQGDASFKVAVCTDSKTGQRGAELRISVSDSVGGIATSGWDGRSHSLGIADAVTVLAPSAAAADAAATLIANAVDLPGSPQVKRVPAKSLSPDSDLGDHSVTVSVAALGAAQRQSALQSGERYARQLIESGIIRTAFLSLQGDSRVVGAALPASLTDVSAGNF